jgi:hypothetical protein
LLPEVERAKAETTALFRRIAADDSNGFMGSIVDRTAVNENSFDPNASQTSGFGLPQEQFNNIPLGEGVEELDLENPENWWGADRTDVINEHKNFSAQLLASSPYVAPTLIDGEIARQEKHAKNQHYKTNTNI